MTADTEREYVAGERLLLRLVVGAMGLLGAAGVAVVALGNLAGTVGGVLTLVMVFGVLTLPYVQAVVALPLATVLHVHGRTQRARGVLRAAAIVFVGYGLLYGCCSGGLGLSMQLDTTGSGD